MSDVAIGWVFGLSALLILIALVVMTGRMVWKRYRDEPIKLAVWLVALICVPFLGVASWLIWNFWIEPEHVSRVS